MRTEEEEKRRERENLPIFRATSTIFTLWIARRIPILLMMVSTTFEIEKVPVPCHTVHQLEV